MATSTGKNCIQIVLILLSVLAISSCTGQMKSVDNHVGIPDTTYRGVYEIADSNLTTDGHNFLINRVIPHETKSPVVFVSAKVPSGLLSHIYPEFRQLTVITPNWTYYDEAGKSSIGEPIASSVIYRLDRENITIDSVVIMGGFPKMEMSVQNNKGNHAVRIYYSERYGSVCCPKDPMWDLKPVMKAYVHDFERENKVKTGPVYLAREGKEGEATYYYPLTGISNELRLKFITGRTEQISAISSLKDKVSGARIYTPAAISTEYVVKIDQL